jgi:coenzyme F420-0:L-glutamate ligase/coenzyme F420-1:gamma-L-glutamate ligase
MKKIEILGLQTIPEINPGDDLPAIIVQATGRETASLCENDIVVLTSKIVSKALGLTKRLADVKPGKKALAISRRTGKDPKWVQMILDAGQKILAVVPLEGFIRRHITAASQDAACAERLCENEKVLFVTAGKNGRIHTVDGGIDGSNHPAGVVSFLPDDPDLEAKIIREKIRQLTGKTVAVILADTEIIPLGTMDFAVGSAGIEPISRQFGQKDLFGKCKFGGMDLIAHELCATAALLFGQTAAGVPVAIIRGCDYQPSETANIANTLLPQAAGDGIAKIVKAILSASACVKGAGMRLLLRIASQLIR